MPYESSTAWSTGMVPPAEAHAVGLVPAVTHGCAAALMALIHLARGGVGLTQMSVSYDSIGRSTGRVQTTTTGWHAGAAVHLRVEGYVAAGGLPM